MNPLMLLMLWYVQPQPARPPSPARHHHVVHKHGNYRQNLFQTGKEIIGFHKYDYCSVGEQHLDESGNFYVCLDTDLNQDLIWIFDYKWESPRIHPDHSVIINAFPDGSVLVLKKDFPK
jgi:hypothetical protein